MRSAAALLTLATCPHRQKLALPVVIALEPVGFVVGGRAEAIDDDWGGVEAVIRLDAAQFGPDAVAGLDAFSHLVVVFQFHLVDPADVQIGRPPAPGEPGLARGGHVRPAGQDATEPPRRVDLPPHRGRRASTCTCGVSMPSTGRRCSTSSPTCGSSSRPAADVRQPPGPPS